MQNLENLWSQVLEVIEKRISKPSFDTWLKVTTVNSFKGNALYITAPSDFTREWLEEHYSEMVKTVLFDLLGEEIDVKFVISQLKESSEYSISEISTLEKIDELTEFLPNLLNQKYTFENFVIGAGNKFAHAASLAVGEAQ
jgi:chromosomal replication initiator protein